MRWRKILRIARWEVSGVGFELDRKTVLAVLMIGLVFVGSVPLFLTSGVSIDEGIYRIGVDEDSKYYSAVKDYSSLTPVNGDADNRNVDVLIKGDSEFQYETTPKGKAALSELREAVSRYNERLMQSESANGSETAAFPVEVELIYKPQETGIDVGDAAGAGGGSGGSGGGSGGGNTDDNVDSGGTGGGIPGLGSSFLGTKESYGNPGGITPPFPFEALILAFLFLIPMNFVIQAYSSSVIEERINRRGELMLVSPVTRLEIIMGKTLPYFTAVMLVSAVIAVAIGAGPVSVAVMAPVALVFLAAAFVGSMFARSFKELTFVTVTISVLLTSYVFVPAIFTQVTPIASISPITIVVLELKNRPIELGRFLFASVPLLFSSLVLFGLGAGVYRSEDMFNQKKLRAKALDSMVAWLYGVRSAAKMSFVFIPFVFAVELMVLALLFVFPYIFSLPLLLIVIAFVEEYAKSIAIYAGYRHGVFNSRPFTALKLGFFSGLGFFIGEKLTLLTQLVGIPELELGKFAFASTDALNAGPEVALILLLMPLALHSSTAAISSLGARRGKTSYYLSLGLASVIHAAYNYGVVSLAA
ncbi:MAG: PrsW family intramembrane metalloprotease [Halobacteria archaeon]